MPIFHTHFHSIKLKSFLLILLLILLFPQKAYPGEDKKLYYQAVETARRGNIDFAFMQFRKLLRKFPKSKFSKDALFAIGEYYFLIGAYYDAGAAFSQFINGYPESKAIPFALAYLLKIAQKQQREDSVEFLKKELLKLKQHVFLFKEFKEQEYLSPFARKHKIMYFIDRIEVYIGNDLFTETFF